MEINRNNLWENHDRPACLSLLTYAELLTTLALSDAKVIVQTYESRITPLLNESYLSLCQVKYAIKRLKVFKQILFAFKHALNIKEPDMSDYYLTSYVYARIKNGSATDGWSDLGYPVEAKIRDSIKPITDIQDLKMFKRAGTVHDNFIKQLEPYIGILADDIMPALNKMVARYCPAETNEDRVYRIGAEIVSTHQLYTTDVQYLRSIVSQAIIRVSYDPCINDEELDRKRVEVANEYGEYGGSKADEGEDVDDKKTRMVNKLIDEATDEDSEEKPEVATRASEDEEEDTDDAEEKPESAAIAPQARYIAYQPVCAAIRQSGSYLDGWEVVDVDERLFGHITSVNSEIGTASVQWYKEGARCVMSIPLSMLIKADIGAFMDNRYNIDKRALEFLAGTMRQRWLSFPHLMESMKDRIQDESRYDV